MAIRDNVIAFSPAEKPNEIQLLQATLADDALQLASLGSLSGHTSAVLAIRFVGHAASEDTTRTPPVTGIQTTHMVVVVVVVVLHVRAILVRNRQI